MVVLGKDLIQSLDDTTVTVESKYSINFRRSQRKFCLSLHYSRSNSYLFVSATKIYQFKVKNFEIKPNQLCLVNILETFTANIMIKKRIKWIHV